MPVFLTHPPKPRRMAKIMWIALLLSISMGASFAAASRDALMELEAHKTGAFRALLLVQMILVVPVCLFFHAFYGDWFVTYAASLGAGWWWLFAVMYPGVAIAGFYLTRFCFFEEKDGAAIMVTFVPWGLAFVLSLGLSSRFGLVGTTAQFAGDRAAMHALTQTSLFWIGLGIFGLIGLVWIHAVWRLVVLARASQRHFARGA